MFFPFAAIVGEKKRFSFRATIHSPGMSPWPWKRSERLHATIPCPRDGPKGLRQRPKLLRQQMQLHPRFFASFSLSSPRQTAVRNPVLERLLLTRDQAGVSLWCAPARHNPPCFAFFSLDAHARSGFLDFSAVHSRLFDWKVRRWANPLGFSGPRKIDPARDP